MQLSKTTARRLAAGWSYGELHTALHDFALTGDATDDAVKQVHTCRDWVTERYQGRHINTVRADNLYQELQYLQDYLLMHK